MRKVREVRPPLPEGLPEGLIDLAVPRAEKRRRTRSAERSRRTERSEKSRERAEKSRKRTEKRSRPIRNRSRLTGSSAVSALVVHVCDERAPSRRQTPGNKLRKPGLRIARPRWREVKSALQVAVPRSPRPGALPERPGYGPAARTSLDPGRRSRNPARPGAVGTSTQIISDTCLGETT
jgi:hypothetical protein